MSVFAQPRPARIRLDVERPSDCVDVVVPCYVAAFPSPDGQIAFHAHYQTPLQLAELVAGLIRVATVAGAMQDVMRILTTTPTQMDARISQPPKPGEIPPDDLPTHLRNGRK